MSDENEQLIKTPGKFGENFMLERELGRGGMGGVYLGRDVMLDRPVAVKVMLKQYGDDAEFLSSFKREAQAAAKLIHPNIAQIYSYGVVDGMPYIAMELVAGGSLMQLMRNAPDGKTDIPRVLKICEQVAQALRCAADQGLVHGDIKPDNILLDSNGNAKLVDFGLAGMQKNTSEIWGTPYYIAPEKLKKEQVDYRADMYNLGGTLYHALTGVAPFEGEDANAVVRKRFESRPKKPSEVRSDISPAIDALVMKMLALEKQDRYPTFEALLAEFKEVMTNGLDSRTTGSGLAASGGKTRTGGRRVTLRGGRKMTKVKLSGPAPDETEEGDNVETDNEDDNSEAPKPETEGEEDDGDNIGKKFLLGIIGGLVVIGLLAGGVAWYVISDRQSRADAKQASIVNGIKSAREAIADTCRIAVKFRKEYEDYVAVAIAESEATTAKIAQCVPDVADGLKPAVTEELLKAIASTNAPVVTAGSTNDVNAVSNAVTQVDSSTGAAPKSADSKPTANKSDDNTEAVSGPEQKLLKSMKDLESRYRNQVVDVGNNVVKDVHDIWEHIYSCQASLIGIYIGVENLLTEAKKAEALVEETESTATSLGELSRSLVELYNTVKASKDVEKIRKDVPYAKQKSAKAIKQANDGLFRCKAEFDREKAKLEYQLKKLREENADAEARKKVIAEEQSVAQAKFDYLKQNKNFELLEWDSAIRDLEFLKSGFKTAEGALAVDSQIKKVRAMKSVQEIFVKNLKGFRFRKSKLGKANATAVGANMKEILITRSEPNSKASSTKINWVRFYKEYHTNFNELIIQFIENGRRNCNPKLTLQEWADAMCGAALTLRIICADDPAAAARSEQIAKSVAKSFPKYVSALRMMFPDITFEDASDE